MSDLPRGTLLDTHAWIWLFGHARTRFHPTLIAELNETAENRELYLSAISVWELGMLLAKGRLGLTAPAEEFVARSVAAPGVQIIPIGPEIALESTRLPGEVHGDPADRMILATARLRRLEIMTADRAILEYSAAGHVHALQISPPSTAHAQLWAERRDP